MKHTTVFVTYNPNNDFEQTLAVRLQTIGAVHGFNMLLPDRFGFSGNVNQETKYRIKSCDYFILFSTSQLTSIVQEEVTVAFSHLKDKSKILIIYDKVKNLHHNENCTEVFIDAGKDSPNTILTQVINQIKVNQNNTTKNDKGTQETVDALGGILLVGLGLLALGALINSKK